MIDWFPPSPPVTPSDDPAVGDDLLAWQTIVNLRRIARTVDEKDPATRGHSERVADLVVLLATEARRPDDEVVQLRQAALIHDIGKICVPDHILLSPDPLCDASLAAIRAHALLGAEIASLALSPRQVSWVRHHHERWDGLGYPDGLAGDEIPDGALILAMADSYDAMTHRPRSGRLGRAQAIEECMRGYRRQFAPWAVDLVLDVADRLPAGAEGDAGARLAA